MTGPDIAIAAIGAGKRAAESIDQFVSTGVCHRKDDPYTCTKGKLEGIAAGNFQGHHRRSVGNAGSGTPQIRKTNFDESTTTWDQETAMTEASRCLACGCTERYDCELRNYASDYGVEYDSDSAGQASAH